MVDIHSNIKKRVLHFEFRFKSGLIFDAVFRMKAMYYMVQQ